MGDTTIVDPLLATAFPWMFGMSLTGIGSGIAVVLFGKVFAWRPRLRDQDLGEMLLTSHLVDQPVVRFLGLLTSTYRSRHNPPLVGGPGRHSSQRPDGSDAVRRERRL